MNLAEQALETARGVFLEHRKLCKKGCRQFELHRTATLSLMCLQGTHLYKALLKAECAIMKQEKAKENAKIAKAMRREAMKQMQP